MIEVWKDIEGFEGYYQVSNKGRVKSLVRWKRKTEKIIKGCTIGKFGYLQVGLRKGGKVKNFLIHRLVMMAFDPIDNAPDMQVNHKDFNTANNELSNLEWVTCQENIDHFRSQRSTDKTNIQGTKHHLSKLNDSLVREIRKLHSTGKYSIRALSMKYEVNWGTINNVVQRDTWKHVA